MTNSRFVFTLCCMAAVAGAGLYAYAYSLGGPLARAVLTAGMTRLVPLVRAELVALFWRGQHVASRTPAVSPVFADVPGAEGATEAGLRIPSEVSEVQASADEEARILAGFDRMVRDLERRPAWLEAFHEETAASPVYRSWVLETTAGLSRDQIRRAIAEGRELVHAG